MLVDPRPDLRSASAVRLLPVGRRLGHGEDLELAGGLDAALGVGGLAGVPAGVLGEGLLDGDGADAALVLDLEVG